MALAIGQKEKKVGILVGVVFAITVGGPLYGVGAMQENLWAEQTRQSQLNREISELQALLNSIEVEREKIRNNREDYLKWVGRGVVGEQYPVEWVQLLQRIQAARRFEPVGYGFAGEDIVEGEGSPLVGASSIKISILRMHLEFDMLHDLDMLVLMEQLQRQTASFFFPVECVFNRTTPAATAKFELEVKTNLHSECQIDWISVLDPAQDAEALARAQEEFAAAGGGSGGSG